eukprot:gene2345-2297_t
MPTPSPDSPRTPLLAIQAVGKDYTATVLDGVNVELFAGEVLALTGENGAGKSTLSKILCGLEQPTRGGMQLAGQAYAPSSRRDAERNGVRMVMQELGLVPTLTVAENLLMGRLPHRLGWLQRDVLHAAARAQLAKIGLDTIDPATPVSQLGIGQQQMVEIARNLQDDTRILVLDEPTAMLTPRETNYLFEQIAHLTARGVAIIYVSHRLEELRRIADRVAVLRDGRLVDVRPMAGMSEDDLVQRMVGRVVSDLDHRPRRPVGPVVMSADKLGRGTAVQDVSLELRAGEIFGIAGLVGSGRTELVRLLFGADRADRGSRGFASPLQAIAAGVGLVTEDRKSQGLLLSQPIRINATLSDLSAVSRGGWLQRGLESRLVQGFVRTLGIRCRSPEQPLYGELDRMALEGRALLMVSSDLRELMAMADRIGVMSAGRLVAVFERGEWSEQSLLAAAFSEPGGRTSTTPSTSSPLGTYLGLLAVLAGMVALFSSLSEYFWSAETFITIANEIPALAVMAVGMTFVLIIAGIDLSVGSVMALAAATSAAAILQWGWTVPAAAALALATGLVCGTITGMISVAWRLPSFIVSLGMLEAVRGSAYVVTDSRTQYVGDAISWLSAPFFGGISFAFLLAVVLVVVAQLVLSRTVFGRCVVGIGTNEEAMRLAGVDPRPIRVIVFAMTGLLAGLAGLMQSARLEAADPNAGTGMELQVIAAVVIGGTSLMGGRGSVVNTAFGVLIIAVLEAGLAQVGASEPSKRIITGFVIVAAVIVDTLRQRRAKV